MSATNRRLGLTVSFICAVVFVAGCGGGDDVGTLYPVTGKVTCDSAAMTSGSVRFVPNKDRGNTSKYEPVGVIGPDGTFSLMTVTKPGAAAGWYYVSVSSGEIPDSSKPNAAKAGVAARYANPNASKLEKEVVPSAAAGAYDLKVTSK